MSTTSKRQPPADAPLADQDAPQQEVQQEAPQPSYCRCARSAAVVQPAEQRPEPVKPDLVATVGDTIQLEVPEDRVEVMVERPDGTEVRVFASGGRALYVLDDVGVYYAGGLVIASRPADKRD